MKLTTLLLIILIPAMLHPSEFNPVISWNAGIAIDMTGIWDQNKANNQLKEKNFNPGSTREWR